MTSPDFMTVTDAVRAQERTCRYGHGPLHHVTKIDGKEIFVAVAMGFVETARNAPPNWMGPLQWHLCGTCGYMEVVDITPNLSIERAKA